MYVVGGRVFQNNLDQDVRPRYNLVEQEELFLYEYARFLLHRRFVTEGLLSRYDNAVYTETDTICKTTEKRNNDKMQHIDKKIIAGKLQRNAKDIVLKEEKASKEPAEDTSVPSITSGKNYKAKTKSTNKSCAREENAIELKNTKNDKHIGEWIKAYKAIKTIQKQKINQHKEVETTNRYAVLDDENETKNEEKGYESTMKEKMIQTIEPPKDEMYHVDYIDEYVLDALIRHYEKSTEEEIDELNEIDSVEAAMKNRLLCHQSNQIEELHTKLDGALEKMQYNEELDYNNDEEALVLYEKIDALEYQNTLNLVRLEEFALKEEEWTKRKKEYEEKEKRLMLEGKHLQEKMKEKRESEKEKEQNEVQQKKKKDRIEDFNERWKRSAEERSRHYVKPAHRQKKVGSK